MQHSYKIFDSENNLAQAFAHTIMALTQAKDEVYIALSGGRTPQTIFDVLATDFASEIEWEKLRFFWVDERCVPPLDADSNYKMTNIHLLSKLPIGENQVFRVKGELTPQNALNEYIEVINKNVPQLDGLPCFDLTILGMGDDGHTASVFPHEIELWHHADVCTLGHHPITGQTRVTLTGKVINHSRQIIFMVTGAGKAAKIQEIFSQSSVSSNYPASLVDAKKSVWWLDRAAAQLLS